MSKIPNLTKTGSKKQLPSEASPDAASKPGSSKLSSSLLTVENVKKHQEENPVAKSDLAQWSIETYIEESNRFLNESEAKAKGSREQAVSNEEESRVLHEGYPENTEQTLGKDFQSRPLSAPVFEPQSPKKREVADLETQTEWSYSVSSEDSSELKIEREEQSSIDGEKKSESTEGTEILYHAEEEGISDSELETREITSDEERTRSSLLEEHLITDLCVVSHCEFCASILKPFPTPEELEDKPMDHALRIHLLNKTPRWRREGHLAIKTLCYLHSVAQTPPRKGLWVVERTYREVLQCVIQEFMERPGSEIDIRPHVHLSLTEMESKTKRMLVDELQERGFERYKEIFMQYMKYGPCVKVHFKLSDHPPLPETSCVKRRHPDPKELLEIDLEFKAQQLKLCHPSEPVKRCYQDGKIFFLLFPDGTGQVYYPSGHLALLISYVQETQFTYCILGDSRDQEPLAFFTNQGYAAYYQPKGRLRLQLDLCNGSLLDKKGQRQKFWNWWATEGHVHAPPFQPICLQLNVYIQVKIKAQDQVFFTFTKAHDCLHLNVGARLKLKDPDTRWVLQQHRRTKVRPSVLEKISRILANVKAALKQLDSEPTKAAADLRLVCRVYERLRRRHKRKQPQRERR